MNIKQVNVLSLVAISRQPLIVFFQKLLKAYANMMSLQAYPCYDYAVYFLIVIL